MVGNILVGIALRLTGAAQATRGFEEIDIASRRAAIGLALARKEISSLDAAIGRNALTNESLALRQQRLMENTARQASRTRGMIAGAFALGGAVAIGAAVDQAAKFQLAMTSVNNTLGATSDQMRVLNTMALHVSGIQAQSATTIAQEMSVAARAGLGQYDRLHSLFPLLARFADVQYFMAQASGQSMSPQDAVGVGVQFAHLFQAYTPQKMGPMLEWITKLQTVSNESLQRALTQGRYFIPMGNVLGLSMEQQFELLASMAQTGFLRGRGGSSLGRTFLGAINAATMTGHSQSKQTKALEDLGIIRGGRNQVVTADGKLNWDAFTRILTGDASSMKPAQYIADLKAGFGVVSSQFMSVFTSKAVQDQLGHIRRQFERLGDDPIGKFFDNIMNNFLPQFQRFVTNFVNLGINIMLPILPMLTSAFKSMADVLGNIGDWFGAHPQAGFATALVAMGAVGAAAVYATATLWAFNRAIWGTAQAAAAGSGGSLWGQAVRDLKYLVSINASLVLIASTIGLLYGIFAESRRVARHPEQARREQWFMSGANRGMMPPNTSMDVDVFGRPFFTKPAGAKVSTLNDYRQAQAAEQFRKVLQQHLSAPIVNALTGGSSTSVAQEHHAAASATVEAIHAQTSAIVEALTRVGITINVPATPGQYKYNNAFGPHGPKANTGGHGGQHPTGSPRTGAVTRPR